VDRFYSIAQRSWGFYEDLIKTDCGGKRVLEYGCGQGSLAFDLAKLGADVSGIDISDVAIDIARDRARSECINGLDFMQMDAEALTFKDESFDLICGSSIIHHLDLNRAFFHLARTLKPDGKAVFLEPLGHNAFINVYRHFTPDVRTPDEHPLIMKDFKLAKAFFSEISLTYFHLFSFMAVPVRRTRLFRPLLKILDWTDKALFSLIPYFGRFAWMTVMTLSKPRRLDPNQANSPLVSGSDFLGDARTIGQSLI
jgi:SAM-dependent methyltransferase